MMNKLFLILWAALLVISVQGVEQAKQMCEAEGKVRRAASERSFGRNLEYLHQDLKTINAMAKVQVSQSSNKSLQHMVVQNSRNEIFAAYDSFLEKSCHAAKSMKTKKLIVKAGLNKLTRALYELDGFDMHNGCFTAGILFESLSYE